MHVVSQGRWYTGALAWQPRPGAWAITIACSDVFSLMPGGSPRVAFPLDAPELDDDRRFVEPWGPIAPVKRWPEVVVVGSAYAPPGARVASVLARLSVGGIDKVLEVHGDSHFTQQGALVGPLPFTRTPLSWSRAAGGRYTANPAGMGTGPDALADTFGRVHVPNLRPVGASIPARGQVLPPAGFGPMGPGWPLRVQRLHRYAAGWDLERWAERPLHDDFDVSYFNTAPTDQTAGELTGNERIVLEHMHPGLPRLVTYLEALTPAATVTTMGATMPLPLRCDTLVFDTDRGIAVLVWRGQLAVGHPLQEGVVNVWPLSADPASTTGTADSTHARPFAPPLPFRPPAPPPSSPPPPPNEPIVETLTGAFRVPMPALPFQSPSQPPTGPEPEHPDDEPPTMRRGSVPAPAFVPVPSPPVFGPPPPSPPPRMGLLEVPEMPRAAVAAAPVREAAPLPLPSPEPPAPAPPEAIEPPREDTLERCAAISARIAHRPVNRDAVLGAERLTLEAWEARHARWLGEIDAELARGRQKLRSAYDGAYVAALEEERGPITVSTYARLSVAADRGQGEAALAAAGLPVDAMMRIRRVWLEKCLKDARTAAEVRAALREAAS